MNATPLLLVDRRMLDAAADSREYPPGAPARAPSCPDLLEETWRTIEPRLRRVALGLGLKADQAADVLQDVYITAIESSPPPACQTELTKWLFKVTLNRCRLEHRRKTRRRRLWQALVVAWQGRQSLSERALPGELRGDVDHALAQLTDLDRTLVVLRYFVELNSREIGELTDLPEGTVRSRLRSARHKLAQELSPWSDLT